MNFNSRETINIFTDASVKITDKDSFTCAGSVAIFGDNEKNKLDNITVSKGTSNYGEIRAVLNGILLALEQRDKVNEINIFSDSSFSIYGLRDWSHIWLNRLVDKKGNIINDTFINSANRPVANQAVFKSIMNTMCKNNLKVNFYHIAGHTDVKGGIQRQIEMFSNSNGFTPNIETLEIVSRMNCYVDNLTKSILNNTDLNKAYNKRIFTIRFPTCVSQIYHYKMLKNEKLN